MPPEIPLDRQLDFMYSVSNTEDIIHVHREKQNTTHMKQPQVMRLRFSMDFHNHPSYELPSLGLCSRRVLRIPAKCISSLEE